MVKKRRSIPAGPVVKKPRRKRDLDKQIGSSLFDDFDKFVDNLKLTPIREHIKRCEQLARRADREGREDDFMNLMALKKEMTGRK